MNVPADWPLPPPGKLKARAQIGFCGGAWHIYDSTGKILRTVGSAFQAARAVNKGVTY